MLLQACTIQNLTAQFNEQALFKHLNFQLFQGKISALIGANGQGKSILLSLLTNHILLPHFSTGRITWNISFSHLTQKSTNSTPNQTIADALGIVDLYQAFTRIKQGTAEFSDYELTEQSWHLPAEWQKLLIDANLPTDLSFNIYKLSEGQQIKLILCRLFLLKDHYLLLDEPSNHLDQESRHWLITNIKNHPAGCLVVSHDRYLLDQIHHTFVLNSFGLTEYHCNYSKYKQLSDLKLEALQTDIKQQKSKLIELEKQKAIQLEKSAQRRKVLKKTKQLRKEPDKFILHAKKAQAQNAEAKLNTQYVSQKSLNLQTIAEKKELIEKIKPQSFCFNTNKVKSIEILRLKDLTLPHCKLKPIHFSLFANEKIHLTGQNGIGKSTLLKVINQNSCSTTEFFKAAHTFYLDQNFSFLKPHLNAIENLRQFNTQLSDLNFRTELGKIRLKTDKALMPLSQLSGGEQLKVALLCISLCEKPIELLLLDEPDNHLDIDSKILFANAIHFFDGAVMLVSHDPYFVKECNITESFNFNALKKT